MKTEQTYLTYEFLYIKQQTSNFSLFNELNFPQSLNSVARHNNPCQLSMYKASILFQFFGQTNARIIQIKRRVYNFCKLWFFSNRSQKLDFFMCDL